MTDRILHNWNFSRFIRLVLGTMVLVQSIYMHEYFLAVVGGLIALLTLFGYSACGVSGCAPEQQNIQQKPRIDYEKLDIPK